MIQFENKITTGGILQLAVMIGGLIIFLLAYEHRITLLESNQSQFKTEFDRRMGDQESQMRTFQRQLDRAFAIMPASKGNTNEFSQTPPP